MANTKLHIEKERTASHGTTHEGEKLERQFWADIKNVNFRALETKLAPEFQSVHSDGIRNRVGELELIKNLDLGDFTLNDFRVTQQGDTTIVTYSVSADETIDDRRLSHRASPRLSVWRKNQGEWQLLAHVNLNPIGNR